MPCCCPTQCDVSLVMRVSPVSCTAGFVRKLLQGVVSFFRPSRSAEGAREERAATRSKPALPLRVSLLWGRPYETCKCEPGRFSTPYMFQQRQMSKPRGRGSFTSEGGAGFGSLCSELLDLYLNTGFCCSV